MGLFSRPDSASDKAILVITWRKSRHSGGGGAGGQECVELASLNEGIGLRDSKAPDAGHLTLPAASFAELLDLVKQGHLDT
ncbi:DUF397 domain-containing protein [Actinomadura sp. 9N407]|uniref:DUF397 domain-containing protein n=1 Tax=Actinomadura sp. 9N407 TaxID=3375154 RepID=UPI00378F60DA